MSVDVQLLCLFAALAVDALVGDPRSVWDRVPHPVVLIGSAIGFLDRTFNRETLSDRARKTAGALSIAALLLAAVAAGTAIRWLVLQLPFGFVLEIAIVAVFLAQKSLADHVAAVARGLRESGLPAGRDAVSRIVGRDPEQLDEAGVARAALESLAENFSDGVVAPAFWYAVGGLPGLLAYKTLNTADSMIGHRTPRHEAFGWAAARLDDLANFPAARVAALLIAAGAFWRSGSSAARRACRVVQADARRHRSPNAGWPEAALAGALDVALSGPRKYADRVSNEPWINGSGREQPNAEDITSALSVFWRACALLMLVVIVAAFLFAIAGYD